MWFRILLILGAASWAFVAVYDLVEGRNPWDVSGSVFASLACLVWAISLN